MHYSLAHIVSDWDVTLKPVVQRKSFYLDIPARPDAADESFNRPSVLQQQQTAYASPNNSEPILPPRQPSSAAISVVKTPRPDITAGLRHKTVIENMKAQGLRDLEIKDFLKDLQYQQTLCSNPLQPAHPMCFPPMVVEGKAYATGKPMSAAQNQAAVSGSCMINLQHKLGELTNSSLLDLIEVRSLWLFLFVPKAQSCSSGCIVVGWWTTCAYTI